MPTLHTIQPGDTLTSLAERYGFLAKTLWNHPENAALKDRRKEMNVLLPGDVVHVPDIREKEVSKPDAARHRFRRKGVPAKYRVQLFDGDKRRANQDYTLEIDGVPHKGKTDNLGLLEVPLPPQARQGRLSIGEEVFRLSFGHLDPVADLSGVRQRLNNLGFPCPEGKDPLDDDTRAALWEFQERFDLKVTGEPDAATRDKLDALHRDDRELPPPPNP